METPGPSYSPETFMPEEGVTGEGTMQSHSVAGLLSPCTEARRQRRRMERLASEIPLGIGLGRKGQRYGPHVMLAGLGAASCQEWS